MLCNLDQESHNGLAKQKQQIENLAHNTEQTTN